MRILDITLPRGYMVRLACSGRTRVWLEYGENVIGTNVKTKHDLNQQIFEGGDRKEKIRKNGGEYRRLTDGRFPAIISSLNIIQS